VLAAMLAGPLIDLHRRAADRKLLVRGKPPSGEVYDVPTGGRHKYRN
jgi:hypothetical protein